MRYRPSHGWTKGWREERGNIGEKDENRRNGWGDGEKVKRRNEGAEARERGRSIEGILIPILLFLPHSCRIEEAFMMGYRFMARLRRYYACIGRSRGGKKGDDGGGGRYLYDFRYLPRWGERGTEREREGGRLERVALWSIVKIMKPKRDFSLFNWRPQTISRMTDCEIPFGSEESRSIREEEL